MSILWTVLIDIKMTSKFFGFAWFVQGCCCSSAYLSSCHQTASDANYWTICTIFIAMTTRVLQAKKFNLVQSHLPFFFPWSFCVKTLQLKFQIIWIKFTSSRTILSYYTFTVSNRFKENICKQSKLHVCLVATWSGHVRLSTTSNESNKYSVWIPKS